MNEIKAFVGHSFTPDDAAVVNAFLKYFDQVQALYASFSWQHAEAAQPIELAEKVLSLIANKNVFVGICTKKERVVAPPLLTSLWFQSTHRKARDADLSWKTSDWIIQEIGLAIGRGLDLILLVEEGIRHPGGLQGNVEYISFNRAAPEKSFGKILEMIKALTPRPAQAVAATGNTPSASTAEAKAPPKSEPDWTQPKPDWSTTDYRRAMFFAIVMGSPDDVAGIDKAYRATDDAKIADREVEWDANAEYIRISFGKGGNLEKLKQIAAAQPKNHNVLFYLAEAHREYGDHATAAEILDNAAEIADAGEKVKYAGFAATAYARAGKIDRALSTIDCLRNQCGDTKTERTVLGAIREMAGLLKENDTAVSAMERIVEMAPDDTETRFDLAFKHSELGNDDMALHHYSKIPFSERTPMLWNNLGVAFDHFDMPGKAVSAYRWAEGKGETLSMSNLGQKFLKAGFLKEAQEEFDKALAIRDYHKNIGHGILRIKEIPDEEEKKEQEVLEGARQKVAFYQQLGRAVLKPPVLLQVAWRGPDCEFAVSISGNKFKAVGSYERDGGGGLLGALTIGGKVITKYRLEYEGTAVGRQIEGTVRRIREGDTSYGATLLGLNDTKSKVLIVVSDDGGTLRVMENPHTAKPSYYDIAAI